VTDDDGLATNQLADPGLRAAARRVLVLNLGYFGIEFAVALMIGSVALFADSIDFLEDASVNLLLLLAVRWGLRSRARLGRLLALLILAPTIATLWMAGSKILAPVAPAPLPLSVAGAGALIVNAACAICLAPYRAYGGSLTRAAFLSARNDVLANLAIILAAVVTAFVWTSAGPDLIVGLGIAAINADAAREVWSAAGEERQAAG
jgi:Co/Zn/Cd efflux system component